VLHHGWRTYRGRPPWPPAAFAAVWILSCGTTVEPAPKKLDDADGVKAHRESLIADDIEF
jgi:hypothetical protein